MSREKKNKVGRSEAARSTARATLKVRLGSVVARPLAKHAATEAERNRSLRAASDDEEFFAKSMGRVTPLENPKPAVSKVSAPAASRITVRPRRSSSASEFVVLFEEDRVSAYRKDLGPAVLHALSRSRWQPQASLDLHGKRAAPVRAQLHRELFACSLGRAIRILIIHGKGLHSGGRSVLRQVVVEALTDAKCASFVQGFRTAPPRLGGTGALVVQLGAGR